MRVIRGKKALVTGAASGIGRAIAIELARQGADLFLIDIKAEPLRAVAVEARTHGVAALIAVCDLARPDEISAVVDKVRSVWGSLNILVNNAGIAYYGPTHLMNEGQWQRIMAVNLMAPLQLVRETFPLLAAAEEAHILNVCSFFGLGTWRKITAYQTTKFALVGFTAALRAEYCRDTFGVTALCPGFVRSALLEECETAPAGERPLVPSWICATPEKTASRAVRAIRRNQGMVVITPAAQVYWRLVRLCPRLVDWLMREGWRRRGKIIVGEMAKGSH
jgi:3-oxoacyl-[acyl-carrier protein] reductase